MIKRLVFIFEDRRGIHFHLPFRYYYVIVYNRILVRVFCQIVIIFLYSSFHVRRYPRLEEHYLAADH